MNKIKQLMTALMLAFAFVALAETVTIDEITYSVGTNGTASVTYQSSNTSNYQGVTEIVIPDSVSYNGSSYKVTAIGSSAFRYASSLKSIVIPKSVSSIGYRAFSKCSSLQEIEISDSVESVSSSAFEKCTSLKKVTLGRNLTSLDYTIFDQCANISTLVYNSVKCSISTGGVLFGAAKNIENLIIGEGVVYIPTNLFNGNAKVDSIHLPSSVATLGESCFADFKNLKTINLDNVSCIETSAFSGCSSLNCSVILKRISLLMGYAFSGTQISDLKIYGSPVVSPDSFSGMTNSVDVYLYSVLPPMLAALGSTRFGPNNNTRTGFINAKIKSVHVLASSKISFATATNVLVNIINHADFIYLCNPWSKYNINYDLELDDSNGTDDGKDAYSYLKVTGSETHNSVFKYREGEKAEVKVEPEDGWEIYSVVYNGVDVTSELVDNTYTTEALSGDNTLEIIMRQSIMTGIDDKRDSTNLKISAGNGMLTITGSDEMLEKSVTNLSGVTVYKGYENRISLSSGIYILTVGNQAFKFAI